MHARTKPSAILIALALAAGALPALAQSYPARPVRIITAGAGTFHDIVTREFAQRLSARWGQPVVVENQPAAALTIGTGIAAKATPDGHTLVMSDRSALAVAPWMYKNLPYDVAKDLAPITLAALAPSLLVAHPTVPAANLAELLTYLRAQPNGVQVATAGPGTNPHVAMELFKQATGLNATAIHYKGGGASSLAVVAGEVKLGFGSLPVVLPHVRAGRMKAYVITGKQRFPGAPDIPTATESGIPGMELEFWIGLLAPARTPPQVVVRVNRDAREILEAPEMRATLLAQGATAAAGSPESFAEYIAAESARMKRLVELTGMRVD